MWFIIGLSFNTSSAIVVIIPEDTMIHFASTGTVALNSNCQVTLNISTSDFIAVFFDIFGKHYCYLSNISRCQYFKKVIGLYLPNIICCDFRNSFNQHEWIEECLF